MKHSIRLAIVVAGLLAPFAAPHAAAPLRIEQGSLVLEGIPADALATPPALARMLESRPTGFVDWLADGSMVVATQAGNTAQLHRISTPMGAPAPLTFKAEPITQAIAHPYDASRLLYMQDSGGNERAQIWLRNLLTGEERLLTDDRSRHGEPTYARDGRRIAFAGNARDGVSNDLYVADIDAGTGPRLLLGGGSEVLSVQDWSADDRQLAVIRRRSITDSELLLVNVASGEQLRIELAPAPVQTRRRNRARRAPAPTPPAVAAVTQARFARDGRSLYFICDRGGEFLALHHYDLYTRQITTLTPGTTWDVERFDLSPDGRFLAYTRNEGGISRLVLHDLGLKADVLLPFLPAGAVISTIAFDNAGRRLAVALQTAQAPEDVYVLDLDTATGSSAPPLVTLTRWTQAETSSADAARFVAAELVQFPTWDRTNGAQRLIPAFVYRPRTPGPHPVLIDLHGGAESQHRPGWSSFRQYLVGELGYAVVAPNVRGSAGHGRAFLSLDDGEQREDPLRDIGALLVWIGLQPQFDRGHVVVAGHADGGRMALDSLVTYPDRLAGGVHTVSDGRAVNLRLLPLVNAPGNVAAIRRPLLVVRGLNDPRMPANQSEQMVALVRAQGNEVWYLAAKDEGDGFQKKASSDVYRTAMAAFLRRIAGP